MIKTLSLSALRNLSAFQVSLGPQFNVFYGDNGVGKTSVLEGLHLLGVGRSFRTHRAARVVRYGEPCLTAFCETLDGHRIGVEKHINGDSRYRLNGEPLKNLASLAEILPLQLINPYSYQLVEGPSKLRRQFLDWGVFHVEPQFMLAWQQYSRALKQRNRALKAGGDLQTVQVWDKVLIETGRAITAYRREYLTAFERVFQGVVSELLDFELGLSFKQGWAKDAEIETVLKEALPRDRILGYTQNGAHRADLGITVEKIAAADHCSRGQMKLLVTALRLAQGRMLREVTGKRCLYLIDDFAAELDVGHRVKLLGLLAELEAQVFITVIEPGSLGVLEEVGEVRMFHVEQCAVGEGAVELVEPLGCEGGGAS